MYVLNQLTFLTTMCRISLNDQEKLFMPRDEKMFLLCSVKFIYVNAAGDCSIIVVSNKVKPQKFSICAKSLIITKNILH